LERLPLLFRYIFDIPVEGLDLAADLRPPVEEVVASSVSTLCGRRAIVAISARRGRCVMGLLPAVRLILARLVVLQLVLFLAMACLGIGSRRVRVPIRVALILIAAVRHDVADVN
jgi:hypothetical protein